MRAITTLISIAATMVPALATAQGQLEAGATLGGHIFSSTSELGTPDRMGGASPQSSILFGGRIGYWFLPQLVGEAELVVIPTVDDDQSQGAAVFGARLHVRYDPFEGRLMNGRLHPFLLAGYGLMAVRSDSDQLNSDSDQAFDWGLGAHYTLTAGMDLRLDARHVVLPDRSKNGATSNFEMSAGVTWHFGARRPTSQTRMSIASAPATPSTVQPAAVVAQPATVAPGPGNSKTATAAVAAAPPTPPGAVATARVELPADLDQDRDGVPIPQDACAQEPEDRDGFRDDDGCPDPDNDGDGIVDPADRCATDPETVNGYADGDGCPDPRHPDMAAVSFDRGSNSFTAEAAAMLDKAFQVLQICASRSADTPPAMSPAAHCPYVAPTR
jgi:Outer membrane protein beta-barrel domain